MFTEKKQCAAIACLNCQSIKNKTNVILDFILDQKLSLCFLTETWLEHGDDFTPKLAIPDNFACFSKPRKHGRGGGIATLFDKNLNCIEIDDKNDYKSFENQRLLANINGKRVQFIVVYRVPPSQKNGLKKTLFLDEFITLLDDILLTNDKIVLLGDFNIHFDETNDHESKCFKKILETFDLIQHVQGPTHRCGHTLDLMITRKNDNILSDCCIKLAVSDHNAIVAKLTIPRPQKEQKIVKFRKLNKIPIETFITEIEQSDLLQKPEQDLNDLVCQYNTALTTILDKYAPIKTKRVICRPENPWFCDKIRFAKIERRKCEIKWRSNKSDENRIKFNESKLKFIRTLEKAKTDYYNDKITACGKDQKSLFRVLNQLMRKSNENILPNTDKTDVLVDKFNIYFVDKIKSIRSNLQCDSPVLLSDEPQATDHFMKFRQVPSSKNTSQKPVMLLVSLTQCQLSC